MENKYSDIDLSSARSNIVDTISRFIKLSKNGKDYSACCPFHDEQTPSFTVSDDKEFYHCFGCGAHGDAIAFVMNYEGLSFPDAVQRITGNLPHSDNAQSTKRTKTHKPKPAVWQPLSKAREPAKEKDFEHYRHGKPSAYWTYYNAENELIGYICRFPIVKPDKTIGKETIPIAWCVNGETGSMEWRWLSFGVPRPLYGLQKLKTKKKIIIFEGEKTADAGQDEFPKYNTLAWPGGGNAVNNADFSPLHGEDLILWPDFDWQNDKKTGEMLPEMDQPGVKAMRAVYEANKDTANSIRIVKPSRDFPDGWDVADDPPYPEFNAFTYAKENAVDASVYFSDTPSDSIEQNEPIIYEDDPGQFTKEIITFEKPMDIFAEFPVPSLQIGMLPEVIEHYADECGELIGVDLSMVALPAIVACAAAIHDGFKIQPKRFEKDWTESARLWCAIVGDPSVKKTPAISRGVKRLKKINIGLAESNQKHMADYLEQMEQYKDAKKAKDSQGVPEPDRPPMQRVIVEDTTIEALSEVLKDNHRGVLCLQDELSGWFGSMDAYSGNRSGNKDRSKWLQIYNGGSMIIDRIQRGSINIKNWSACMIGGIQPDSIRKIAANMPEDGLMQRFMIVVGKNANEFDREENYKIKQQYSDLIDKLYALQPADESITLSPKAQEIRDKLKEYGDNLATYKMLPGGMRSHLGKWPGLAARLMLTYHVIECAHNGNHPNDKQISEKSAKQVDSLMRDFLLPHALSYYQDIIGGAGDLEHARWIAGFILSKNLVAVSNRDLIQAYKSWRGFDDWQRHRVMQTLDDMGWVKPAKTDASYNKKRSTLWAVNPEIHTEFSELAQQESERRQKIKDEIRDIYERARE